MVVRMHTVHASCRPCGSGERALAHSCLCEMRQADEDISSSVEPTPRTQNLSIDEEDAREALEATINIPAPSPAERKQPTSPTQRSPRADSGELGGFRPHLCSPSAGGVEGRGPCAAKVLTACSR